MTAMTSWYRYENRRRDKVEGGRPVPGTHLNTMEQYDLAPGEPVVIPRQFFADFSKASDMLSSSLKKVEDGSAMATMNTKIYMKIATSLLTHHPESERLQHDY